LALLDHYRIPIEGCHAVVVGRSNLVGRPAAALLQRRHATVTMAHSRTRELGSVTRTADILVAAAGRARMITPDMVKSGAAVLDVGMTREDGAIVGDVDPEVADVAGYLTPMPGGTGLMTVAMVIDTTVAAARRRRVRG
jgi:methylenetetrahydrofolate dehydrogenase (NADP+)/methenyltetrahydrofolate cyclohydrolase